MKKTVLLFLGLCISTLTNAQITLDYSNAPSVELCQTFDSSNTLKLHTLPVIAPGENVVWDLTSAEDSVKSYFEAYPASNPAFPDATFKTEIFYPFSGLRYFGDLLQNVTPDGITSYGVHIDRQAIPLALLTGSVTDSLIFNNQDVLYSTPAYKVKYPITMGDKWTDNYKFNTSFGLTILAYGLVATPGERRTDYTIDNEVIGWGTVIVKDKNGNPTNPMDVLMIKTTQTAKDSFYLAGAPAPAPLLAAFGLSQGQQAQKYEVSLRRPGEYNGLVDLEYADANFSEVSDIHVQELRLSTSSVKKSVESRVTVFPNPLTSRSFSIKVEGNPQQFNYQLLNLTGQTVSEGRVNTNSTVNLNNNLPAGSYFLKLLSNTGQFEIKQIQIVN